MYILYENGFKRHSGSSIVDIIKYWIDKDISSNMKSSKNQGRYGYYYVEKDGVRIPDEKMIRMVEKFSDIYNKSHKNAPKRIPNNADNKLNDFDRYFRVTLSELRRHNFLNDYLQPRVKGNIMTYILPYNNEKFNKFYEYFLSSVSNSAAQKNMSYDIIHHKNDNDIVLKIIYKPK